LDARGRRPVRFTPSAHHCLKTEFALNFFKPGGAAVPPEPPPRTSMDSTDFRGWRFY